MTAAALDFGRKVFVDAQEKGVEIGVKKRMVAH